MSSSSILAERIDTLATEFAELEPRERLELLLEYSKNLPPLPAEYEAQRLAGEHRVHECMTPVFLWVDVVNGLIQVHGWVAPEAPTVKGFVGIAREIFDGLKPAEVSGIDTNLVQQLGLSDALGMQRSRGLNAVLFRIRKTIQSLVDNESH